MLSSLQRLPDVWIHSHSKRRKAELTAQIRHNRKRALDLGSAEGLLVHGEGLAGHLPEEKAYAIHGVDAETVVVFEVQRIGAEFWARWGRKAATSAIEHR